MALQMAVEAVHGKVDPFALRAGAVVVDKGRLKERRDNFIAEGPLDHPLADMHAADMPPFAAIVKLKLIEALAFIGPVKERLVSLCGIADNSLPVSLRRAFPADIFTADKPGLIEVIKREDLLEVAAGLTSGKPFLLSFPDAALVSRLAPLFACHKRFVPSVQCCYRARVLTA